MFLSRLRVANFRGIGEVELDLDPIAVLIGENNAGKTSLLDALALCLGVEAEGESFAFRPEDFRRPDGASPCAPVEIELVLREREAGEWRRDRLEKLTGVAYGASSKGEQAAEIRLHVVAEKDPEDDEVSVVASFADRRGRALTAPGLLSELRRLAPFILVVAERRIPADRRAAPDLPRDEDDAARREVERRIESVYHELAYSRSADPPEDLQEGLLAVGEWLERRSDAISTAGDLSRLMRDLVPLQGSGIRSVGLLFLLGALLEARGPRRLAEEAHPIVAIEEPEAHLHPLMLSAIWALIASVRAQKIVTTNSAELLAAAPLDSVRRLVRRGDAVAVHRLAQDSLDADELRRVAYHVRVRRGAAFFARCWLMVEGETEFWLLPEMARLCGCDLVAEGIELVEFSQCGPEPLVKLANDLGIGWYLFVDGDESGKYSAASVRRHLDGMDEAQRITVLRERDVEHCLWNHGYAGVYRSAAGEAARSRKGRKGRSGERPGRVIERAVRKKSKPQLAIEVARAAGRDGSPGVPDPIRRAVLACVQTARAGSPQSSTSASR